MGTIHFMNVCEGDCVWIVHPSGHNSVIDVSCATETEQEILESFAAHSGGNHNQKNYPVNPIEYMQNFSVDSIFRFILTHPDMDHLDGIESLFDAFSVINFWDTANNKIMDDNSHWGKYKKSDWDFYQKIRKSEKSPIALNFYAGARNKYFNINSEGQSGGDGLYILAPTKELVGEANECEEYNDCSYVILYRTGKNKKIIFAGDSAEKTWDYILDNHKSDVTDIDVLFAPHHGRKSGGNRDYLDTLNPKLTLFGNAKSDYLDYVSWNTRGLRYITNNQANCVVLNTNADGIDVYVTYETYARKCNSDTYFSEAFKAWFIETI